MTELFVLQQKVRLPHEGAPAESERYDATLQLWLDCETENPVVCREQRAAPQSRFGETTATATKEGSDQREAAFLVASKFGETSLTDTVEGADTSEVASIWMSRFGETTMTKTQEGADQTEGGSIGLHGFDHF